MFIHGLQYYVHMYPVCFAVKKKKAVQSLLDNTRSRNIEIFLPSFPLKVEALNTLLDQQLNVIDNNTELSVEHIVALKRYMYSCIIC